MLRGGEQLIKLGRQAAELFLKEETPLDDAVVKVASAAGNELTAEQVKRVCESANHAVNASLLKSADDQSDRYVEFALADPQIVTEKIAELREKASQPDDYDVHPSHHFPATVGVKTDQEKIASSQEEASLLEIFEGEDAEQLQKEAEMVLQKMVSARNVLIEKIAAEEAEFSSLDRDVDRSEEDLYEESKKALLSGEAIDDVKVAVMASLGEMSDAEGIWGDIHARLKAEGLIYDEDSESDYIDTDVLVDDDSGIFKAASRIRGAYREVGRHTATVKALDQQIVGINKDMQKVAFFMGVAKNMGKNAIKDGGKKVQGTVKPRKFRTKSDNMFDAVFAAMGPDKKMLKTKVI